MDSKETIHARTNAKAFALITIIIIIIIIIIIKARYLARADLIIHSQREIEVFFSILKTYLFH